MNLYKNFSSDFCNEPLLHVICLSLGYFPVWSHVFLCFGFKIRNPFLEIMIVIVIEAWAIFFKKIRSKIIQQDNWFEKQDGHFQAI